MRLTIANLDAMARFSAWICSAVRPFRVQKKPENSACNSQRWVYGDVMKLTKQNHPVLPTFSNGLTSQDFNRPKWSKYAGEAGGFVAESRDGQFEAIAEPMQGGWQFWLVRTSDGETLREASCAA